MTKLRVAIICDYLEEGWESMNLVGDSLVKRLSEDYASEIQVRQIRPIMKRRLSRVSARGEARNADRFINRFYDYSRTLKGLRNQQDAIDVYHLVDHSYSQLVHSLPAERTLVTCHDLDTFRCVLEPEKEVRPRWFKAMTRRTLIGFQRAAHVVCDSRATRDEVLAHKLLPPERVSVVPLGVHPTCSPERDAEADAEAERLLGVANRTIEILHVGSTIARKRIDVLLDVFAGVRKRFPGARLIRVGGAFTRAQQEQVERLALSDAIVSLPFINRRVLAAVYRRAALVVLPSEQEGFGLPVVEAMACGTPIIASDLPVLREVGGEAAEYGATADGAAWIEIVIRLLNERSGASCAWEARRASCLAQAAKFSWATYTNRMVEIYRNIAAR
ncbi:MAG: glycosyltransferase family 4 protein [Pyrinomonadaceae bacterium MAG19_C2-C3]|nr:glycosyltransferase family 4 protein [Pyrinomonadaceae bacterium MAG19_C2-C3]